MRPSLAALVLAALAACSPPERNFSDEQIGQVKSYEELMWHLATQADPGFALAKKVDASTITPAQVEQLGSIGQRLRTAAARLAEPAFSKGPGYDKLAAEFGEKVKALETAGASKDGAKTIEATLSLKKTCAACHSAYR